MARSKPSGKPDYLNARLGVERRVADLLGRMTIEEKTRQISMYGVKQCLQNGRVSTAVMEESYGPNGMGFLRDFQMPPAKSARHINAIQKYMIEKTRLGIPAIVVAECLHGHRASGATMFPQAIGLGSTWNPALLKQAAAVAAREARAVGVHQALSPDLDLGRDARWGRIEEAYGEDPHLVARMGVAYIQGMQGANRATDQNAKLGRERLICTAKHYAAYGSPDAGINIAPVQGGLRALRTLYLPSFEAAVREAGVRSIMPSYNDYDGVPASSSKLLLTQILRDEWGFDGFVFSDFGGIKMLCDFHLTAATPGEAARQSLGAGMDVEASSEFAFGKHLIRMVKRGKIPVEWVDRAVSRVLRAKFLAGLFENPYVDPKAAPRVVGSDAHRNLALRVARESIILLKNERKLLPLDRNVNTVAVIGPNARSPQFGDYTPLDAEGVGPFEGIRNAVSRSTNVLYARGCGRFELNRDGFSEAVAEAARADVAIVVVGGSSHSRGGIGWGDDSGDAATCGECYDRSEIGLPGVQEDLVRAVLESGTPTVLVLVNGRPYGIPDLARQVPAIIEAWYPGSGGGTALGEILFGKVNPSGRLPVSIPRSAGHIPCFYNHKPTAKGRHPVRGKPGQPGREYVFDTPEPLFEFGHGLSYTTFSYSNLSVTPKRIPPNGRVKVSVDVRNTGKVAGKEVVQLYVNDVISSVTTPVKELRGFRKISLKPGEKKTVRFTLGPKDLQLLNEEMEWVVEPGGFEVLVGGRKKRFEVASPR